MNSINPPGTLPGNAGHHGVQFYRDETRLCLSVADFLADGLVANQPLVVIATLDHRELICTELALRRFNVERLVADKQLLLLDARKTLNRFFSQGRLDAFAFRETIGRAISMICGGRTDCTVRAYGEMVDVLWREGKCQEAIELEILWNDLAKSHAFSLLCGYAMGSFYKETDRRADLCALHTHVHD
jgi:hypothetical protein